MMEEQTLSALPAAEEAFASMALHTRPKIYLTIPTHCGVKKSWLLKNCNKRVFFLPIRAAHSSDKEGTWGEKCPNWAFISFGLLTGPPSFMCQQSASPLGDE